MQRGGDLGEDVGRAAWLQRAVLLDEALGGRAVDVLHGDVAVIAVPGDGVDLHHQRVIDPRDQASLGEKPLDRVLSVVLLHGP